MAGVDVCIAYIFACLGLNQTRQYLVNIFVLKTVNLN